MIPVTRPFLPPQDEYTQFLSGIWQRQWLTNMGPLSTELELKLKRFLNVKHLLFVTNGTVALQMAMKVLDIKGEVITTPFSFIATSSAIAWEGCKPVYVDIDPDTLTIDVKKIESAITPQTSAILATHVYGNPCDVRGIEEIARKYRLRIIYDAAHAFNVTIDNMSIFEFGDISTCSLHATKLYHSVEGGLVVTKDSNLTRKLAYTRNFGFTGVDIFGGLGINGKNSEYHAAMGLANLKYVDDIIQKRKALSEYYDSMLRPLRARKIRWYKGATNNYAYYPIVFESADQLEASVEKLTRNNIYARRYFYPSLASALPYVEKFDCPVAEDVCGKVLCLPLFYELTFSEIDIIARLLLQINNY